MTAIPYDDFEIEDEPLLTNADTAIKKVLPQRQSALRKLLGVIFASPPVDETRQETAWVDGLRGCAALLVVFSHWGGYAGVEQDPVYGAQPIFPDNLHDYHQWYRLPIFRWVFCSADSAVSIFFIISGFVLSRKSFKYINAGEYDKFITTLSSTAFRRIPRLWIPASISSLLGMIIIKQGYRTDYLYITPDSSTSLQEVVNWMRECAQMLNPFTFYDTLTTSKYEFTLWTIPIEYLGSMAVFLSLVMLCRVRRKTIRRLVFATFAVQTMLLRRQCHYTMFFAGMIFADLSLDAGNMDSTILQIIWTLCFIFAIWVCQIPKQTSFTSPVTTPGWTFLYDMVHTDTIERFWNSVGSILLFFVASRIHWLKRTLESGFCQFLGRISFSLYLLHFQFNDVFGRPHFSPWLIRVSKDSYVIALLTSLLWWSIMLTTVFFLSAWHERWIDRGAVKFSKLLERVIMS